MSNFKPNPNLARDLERETGPVLRDVERLVNQVAGSHKGKPATEVERALKRVLAKSPINFKPAWRRLRSRPGQ